MGGGNNACVGEKQGLRRAERDALQVAPRRAPLLKNHIRYMPIVQLSRGSPVHYKRAGGADFRTLTQTPRAKRLHPRRPEKAPNYYSLRLSQDIENNAVIR